MTDELELADDEVHIWWASLDLSAARRTSLEQTLSQDELDRAARLPQGAARDRFVAAHGLLRSMLSRYLDTGPRQLEFAYSSYGKPALAGRMSKTLNFNMSHADSLALYAVSRRRQIGIDVEYVRPNVAYAQLASRFFTPRERTLLMALPAHQQLRSFFICWTRKEAYQKATGLGLSLPCDRFDVSLDVHEPVKVLDMEAGRAANRDWWIYQLEPAPGYVAALCSEGDTVRLRYRHWPA